MFGKIPEIRREILRNGIIIKSIAQRSSDLKPGRRRLPLRPQVERCTPLVGIVLEKSRHVLPVLMALGVRLGNFCGT